MDATNTNFNIPWQRQKEAPQANNAQYGESAVSDIDYLYFTNDTEKERTTFNGTYTFYSTNISQAEASAGATDGYHFYKALIDFKDDNYSEDGKKRIGLMERLGLDSESYDALACMALAIASQETGLGYETEYLRENQTLGEIDSIHDVGDFIYTNARKTWKGLPFGDSASSGITQLKLYDQIKELKEIEKKENHNFYTGTLKQYGIKTNWLLGKGYDNLAANPEKSAVATMVVLKTILDNYYENVDGDSNQGYLDTMNAKYDSMEKEFAEKGEAPQEALEKGFDSLAGIYNHYQSADEDTKLAIRTALKGVFIASDNTTYENRYNANGDYVKEDEYIEEHQIKKLQEALGGNVEFNQEDVNYIRFAMCSKIGQMDPAEYCAYAWNHGTHMTGMQVDRLISQKLGIIFSNPEDFDYNQYTANVTTIASHYANQITENDDGYFMINDALEDYIEEA